MRKLLLIVILALIITGAAAATLPPLWPYWQGDVPNGCVVTSNKHVKLKPGQTLLLCTAYYKEAP